MRLRIVVFAAAAFLGVGSPLLSSAANQAMMVDCSGQPGCFSPNPLTIPAGTSVSWSNSSSLNHTATSDSGAWDTGVLSPGQSSAAVTFSTPGTFTYHCTIHPSMHGTIVVTAAATAAPMAAPTPAASARPAARALAAGGGGPWSPLALLLGLTALSTGTLLLRRRSAR